MNQKRVRKALPLRASGCQCAQQYDRWQNSQVREEGFRPLQAHRGRLFGEGAGRRGLFGGKGSRGALR